MLNFNNLICKVNDSYSFVGISKTPDILILNLPRGFKDQLGSINSFKRKCDLFFLLYRVLRKFKAICVEKGYLVSPNNFVSCDRDGVIRGDDGSTTTQNLEDPIIFHAKIDSLDVLLSAYDELKISALSLRLRSTDKIDLSKIDRYLHKGVFLPNGAIYIDTMVLPRHQIQVESTDIVSLYCYLIREVKTKLDEDISLEVLALAERFQQNYLGLEDGLFLEHSYDRVIDILKEALYTIDRRTPFKDRDYDDFYEAIEKFLYGDWEKADDGEIWGINNFHSIWESICLTYLTKTVDPRNILFLDREFIPNEILTKLDLVPKSINFIKDFKINGVKLIPDALICRSFPDALSVANYERCLYARDWDDFGYRTRFTYQSNTLGETVRIGYVGQPTQVHTVSLIDRVKREQKLKSRLPLPNSFHSYWKINIHNQNLSLDLWEAMKDLNHIFYTSLRLGAYSFSKFCKEILVDKFKLSVEDSTINGNNVFSDSIFRDINYAELEFQFNSFIGYIFSDMLRLELIDVKYLTLDYVQSPKNISDIRERSIRKQFVYEYLLKTQTKALDQKFSPSISSSFWIPDSSSEKEVLSDGPKYLDGYLKLVTVDIEFVMRSYVS